MGVFPFPMPFSGPPKFGTMFSPLSLFAASEPGGWYDPSDLTTLYQNAAGTTPVTAVEQPVGLVLDKSKGLVLGSELVTPAANQDFSSDTGYWTKSGTTSIGGGVCTIAGSTNQGILRDNILALGKYYQIQFEIKRVGSGAIYALAGTNSSPTFNTLGVKQVILTPINNFQVRFWAVGTTDIDIDNISVRELPGNHLSQSTAAARPVLSARVNALTYTEDFSNAAWGVVNATKTANATSSPLGTNTAGLLKEDTSTGAHYVTQSTTVSPASYVHSICAKPAGRTRIYLSTFDGSNKGSYFDLSNGTVISNDSGVTGAISDAGNGFYRCSISLATAGTSARCAVWLVSSGTTTSYTGDGTSGIYLWGADLRPANAGVGLPAYQRVGAATAGSSTAAGNADYDTTGFPLYLKFDGTDDRLITSTLSPGVDKAQIFVGLRKPNDTVAVAVEYGTNADSNTGAFYFVTGSNAGVLGTLNGYTAQGRGTSAGAAAQIQANGADTAVVTMTHDIAGDLSAINRNGVAGSSATTDKGTGNFGSHVLHVGARNSAALWFAGNLYQLIVRFSATNLDAATITATETWVNGKTKAY